MCMYGCMYVCMYVCLDVCKMYIRVCMNVCTYVGACGRRPCTIDAARRSRILCEGGLRVLEQRSTMLLVGVRTCVCT
jgi:hypothetical protein